ncbi:hypothetical protein [Acaryochloris sp. CCMEE 5410]|uniref:hypothetical protein n=1 Tax=Acaryochloris sp. CCMEE 5410 TaxID=310037 RepID=UPI001111B32D|nr:hypothetical protein [Acaryochloris sp. CCMEE 5410]KAI9132788.1 hypothetical protein ON05_005145 [Acaryochloris sp. CCMEE 5410]
MKKLMLTALTILPLVTTPMVAQPASADVTIKVPIFSGQSRSTVQERRNSRRIYRRTNSRQARRIRRQRRQWVEGRWTTRRGRRVWVPGYYVFR